MSKAKVPINFPVETLECKRAFQTFTMRSKMELVFNGIYQIGEKKILEKYSSLNESFSPFCSQKHHFWV